MVSGDGLPSRVQRVTVALMLSSSYSRLLMISVSVRDEKGRTLFNTLLAVLKTCNSSL